MIIQLEGGNPEDVEEAKRSLEAIAQSWGYEVAAAEATTTHGSIHNDNRKVVDPVSVVALAVSIPSAALAVLDLADRIRNRRRAKEFIDHARQLATRHVTVCVISQSRTVELHTLAPDQLLDLAASEDRAG